MKSIYFKDLRMFPDVCVRVCMCVCFQYNFFKSYLPQCLGITLHGNGFKTIPSKELVKWSTLDIRFIQLMFTY